MLVRNRMTGQLHEVPDHLLYGEVGDGFGLPFLAPLLAPVAAALLPKLLPKVASLVPRIAQVASSFIPPPVAPGMAQTPESVLVAPPPPPQAAPPPPVDLGPPAGPVEMMREPSPREPMMEPASPPIPVRTPSGETVLMRPVRFRRRRRMRRPTAAMNGYGYYYGPSGYGW